jgi:hypothetical protein
MSQFYTSFADSSSSIDFGEKGMCWHSQFLFDTDKVSLAAYLWNDLRVNSDEIERQIHEINFPIHRTKIQFLNWVCQAVSSPVFPTINFMQQVRFFFGLCYLYSN